MGTNWSAKVYLPENISEAEVIQRLNWVFANYIDVFSLWEPQAFISRFNAASVGDVSQVPALFQPVWQAALEVKLKSSDAFNPYCFTEISERGFNPSSCKRPQSKAYFHANPFPQSQSVVAKIDCPPIDLNAIAKGAAVDAMGTQLRQLGCVSFLVEIGGEFFAQGLKEDGQPWWVDIETPTSADILHRVAVSGFSIATSGNTHKQNLGRRDAGLGHILFKKGCDDAFKAVTVLHPHCMYADAWATALFASSKSAMELANTQELAVIFQLPSGEISYSHMLEKHFFG
ncbi:FAD:protein FMN transferase [Hirschia litorea]|uniref:FAD:protein FMN transferase n=1 Tax=Hirschia litorea TaxID=1199156 RepID=A0ABW2IJF4_9PROT